MEQDLRNDIRALGLNDLGLMYETSPESRSLITSTLWRAYGTQECFGVFTWSNPMNVWCGHMYCKPELRGKIAKEIFQQACRKLFDDIDCKRILGLTDKTRRDAIMAARSIGFKRIGEAGGYVFSLLEKGDL